MKTYSVYLLKKIMVLSYYIIFFVLLIAGCIAVHMFVKENNLVVLLYLAVLLIDGLFCYYLSVAAACHRVRVEIDERTLTVDRPDDDGPSKILLKDIIEYEIIGRRIAPKDILELTLADGRKLKFVCKLPWGASDDFDDLVNYFKNRPQVEGLERVAELPTPE